jgi:hypothetical protein
MFKENPAAGLRSKAREATFTQLKFERVPTIGTAISKE